MWRYRIVHSFRWDLAPELTCAMQPIFCAFVRMAVTQNHPEDWGLKDKFKTSLKNFSELVTQIRFLWSRFLAFNRRMDLVLGMYWASVTFLEFEYIALVKFSSQLSFHTVIEKNSKYLSLWLFAVPDTTGTAQEITTMIFTEDSQFLTV